MRAIVAVFIFFTALVFPTTLFAQCAWVLWMTVGSITGPVEGYPNRAECVAEMEKREQLLRARAPGTSLRCLPDTLEWLTRAPGAVPSARVRGA